MVGICCYYCYYIIASPGYPEQSSRVASGNNFGTLFDAQSSLPRLPTVLVLGATVKLFRQVHTTIVALAAGYLSTYKVLYTFFSSRKLSSAQNKKDYNTVAYWMKVYN